MKVPRLNWPVWIGFVLSLIAFLSYPLVFVWSPVTRDFPWANLVLFALALLLVFLGVKRAFTRRRLGTEEAVDDKTHKVRPLKSKIAASILATLSVAIFASFIIVAFISAKWLPTSRGAPQVGQKAPEFTLSDTTGRPVSLTELLSSPVNGKAPKGVLLIFYRGYW
jgi:hypothetical protein